MSMLFNPTNCHVTVNGQWLNDAVSISYQQQASHDPLYGYMDTRFRTVAKSSGLVVGTLGIYFHEHDTFFKYMATAPGQVDPTGSSPAYDQQRAAADKSIRQQEDAADFINFVGSLDLNSEEFAQMADVAFDIASIENPEPVNEKPIQDSDMIGDSGFRVTRRHSSIDELDQNIPGGRIEIYYGDSAAARIIEVLYGVHILGRAKSPIENRAGSSGEPVMEYWSFIASHVTHLIPPTQGDITQSGR